MTTVTSAHTFPLIQREEIAEGTMAFHFAKPADFQFRAGQSIDMTLLNPPETDAEGSTRVFSIASAPLDGDLMIATRMRDKAFKRVLRKADGICVEVSEIGPLHRGKRFACDSALVYTSVIVYGSVRILAHDREKKSWLKSWSLDRLLAKHGDPSWTFEPGYPLIDNIILYEQKIEILTGKHSAGLYH